MSEHDKLEFMDNATATCKHYGNRILMLSTMPKINQLSYRRGSRLRYSPFTNEKTPKYEKSFIVRKNSVTQSTTPANMDSSCSREFCMILQNYTLIEKMQILTELIRDSNRKY